jgi:hypothetical protein
MFQTCIFRENFNKVLMQCSHSKYAKRTQMWSNNYNKTKIVYIWCKYHIYQNFRKCPKNGKHKLHVIVYAKKNLSKICMLLSNLKKPLSRPIFSSHHVMCSSISCCNHLNNMLMNVKLMAIQLELNGIGYTMIFHSYSKSTSNTLICKFEKCKPNSQKTTWVWTYIIY